LANFAIHGILHQISNRKQDLMLTHQLKLRKPLAVFDLETTGINMIKDRIVEISIAKANIDGTVTVKRGFRDDSVGCHFRNRT
jgi:uncharacterized protein YprB with RNaseH-like and TPR domain